LAGDNKNVKNHYETLGLLKTADDVVIKAAYKALAQKYHPDKHKSSKDLYTKAMAELNAAFEALGTKASRKKYDQLVASRAKKTVKAKEKKDVQEPKSAASPHKAWIQQLNDNAMDEMLVLELFEKLFQCKVKINNGWVNTYAFKSGDKTVTLDFFGVKAKIIEHLNKQG
jgi:curved DNA-binding protein CbpA